MGHKLSEELRVIQLKAHAAITVDTTSTGVASGAEGPHRAMAIVDISAVGADADETGSITIEGSNTSISAGFALAHADGEIAAMLATQPIGAQIGKIGLKPFKWYRQVIDVGGTTPSFTYGVHVVLVPSKQPAALQALA